MKDTENNLVNGAGPVSRRRWMAWMVGIINAGIIAAIAGPTVAFIAAPLLRKQKQRLWIPVLDEEELKEGETRAVAYQTEVKDGYMVSRQNTSVFLRRQAGTIQAFDPTCPHLGCHVQYQAAQGQFICPCHGGVFGKDGSRISGPPPW